MVGNDPGLFRGSRVWRGAEMEQSAQWRFTLSADALMELNDLVAGNQAATTPSIDREAERIREELAAGCGLVVIGGIPIEQYTEAQARVLYTELCKRVGPVLPQTLQGDMLYSVRDEGLTLERDYGRAGVRTSKTRDAFQFHTDSPSRLAGYTPTYIGLFVLKVAMKGGETALVSGDHVHNILATERPDVLERLYQPFWVDRRAESPAGEEPVLPTPVFARDNGRLFVRYLRFYITKGHEWKGVPLTDQDLEALDALDEVMNRPGVPLRIAPQPGDIQLMNNTFLLHSRTAYEDFAEPERKRHYLRIWLSE
jgi:hypothetical protein